MCIIANALRNDNWRDPDGRVKAIGRRRVWATATRPTPPPHSVECRNRTEHDIVIVAIFVQGKRVKTRIYYIVFVTFLNRRRHVRRATGLPETTTGVCVCVYVSARENITKFR